MLESSENHWISHAIQGQLRRISYLFQLPELEDLGLHRIMFPDARRRAFRFSQKSKQLMDTRREGGKPRPEADIFSLLVEARDPDTNEALSEQQLWAESNLLIIAGELSFCFLFLLSLFFSLFASPFSTSARKKTRHQLR